MSDQASIYDSAEAFDAIDLKDEMFDAAVMIDGMLTTVIAMQTEIWNHCRFSGIAKSCDVFNEAMTCSLTVIQREVDRLKGMADEPVTAPKQE